MPEQIERIAIVGGGPTGSALATYLAREGREAVIFDPGKRPPIIVGESLVPAIVPFLRRLGVEKKVASFSKFKGGATFIFDLQEGMSFKFHEVPSAKTTYSYNVPRRQFDATLLENSRQSGARVVERRARLSRVAESERLELSSEDLAAAGWSEQPDWIVDASGRNRVVGNLLDLPTTVGDRKDDALHAHLQGVPMKIEGNVHTDRLRHGWSWRIPLPDRVSVGLVIPAKTIREFGGTAEEQFDNYLRDDPTTRDWAHATTRVTPVMRYTNYQLCTERGVGPNWSLVGDAFGFVDPVFSSGMLIGMQGAEALSKAILKGDRRSFEKYEALVCRNLAVWQQVISHYYDGRLLTMFRVGEYVRKTLPGRMMDFHFRRHMPRIFTGEDTTNPYSLGLVEFMCKYGLAGNDPNELAIN